MGQVYEMESEVRQDLKQTIERYAGRGYPWRLKPNGALHLPALEGLTADQVAEFAYGYGNTIARLCADRLSAEICRVIPEQVMITTGEPSIEGDDEAGCDIGIPATVHVMRDGEWESLMGHWDESHPGLGDKVIEWANKWADLSGIASSIEDMIFEPIDEQGKLRQPAAEGVL